MFIIITESYSRKHFVAVNLWLDMDSVNASGDTMIYTYYPVSYICYVQYFICCRMLMDLRFLNGFRAV